MNKALKFILGCFAFPFVIIIYGAMRIGEWIYELWIAPMIELGEHVIDKVNNHARRK